MPTEVSASTIGSEIQIEIKDERGGESACRLSRHTATALVFRVIDAMRNLPPSEGEVMDEDPFLQGYVSFQTGAIETGAIVLALRLRPLPTMHFLLADEQAATLVKEVSQILATPMGMRFQSKKH